MNAQEMNVYEKPIKNISSYNFEEIDFYDKKTKLSGTLISPKTDYDKIVIITPGTGADTRHSHYILTEKLLENGIAVYRYDDRGIGKSKGRYQRQVKINSRDLYYAFHNLKNIPALSLKKIGVIGHSMGGLCSY